MRPLLPAMVLGLLVSTGAAAQDPPKSGVPRDRLPVLGTVGDLPPEAERVILEVFPNSRVRASGSPVEIGEMWKLLATRAVASREVDAQKCSRLSVVLRVDRDTPWSDTHRVLQALAEPRLRIYRVFFAAMSEDGVEGAMAFFLPKDAGTVPGVGGRNVSAIRVEVKGEAVPTNATQGPSAASTGKLLWAALENQWRWKKTSFHASVLSADPGAKTGAVLEAIDILLRWKKEPVIIGPSADSAPSAGAAFVRPTVLVQGGVAPPPSPDDPVPPRLLRVKGRLAGQATAFLAPVGEAPEDEPDETSLIGIGNGAGGIFGGRRREKKGWGTEWGATTEAAVEGGLDWLARHQSPGGSWDCEGFQTMCKSGKCGGPGNSYCDPGVTGLALLAFLAHGEIPGFRRYGTVVDRAIKFLQGIQDAEGCFGPRTIDHFVYNHAIATLAMAEAYGINWDPFLKESAQKGVRFIHRCQVPDAGWRYGVRPKESDTSVTGWMVMALGSARAAGLDYDPDAFDRALKWLDSVTDPDYGRAGYTQRGNGPAREPELMARYPADATEAVTAIALMARFHCGNTLSEPRVAKGLLLLAALPPLYDPKGGRTDFYYWHFGTLAMFQAGGEAWKKWNEAMKTALLGCQRVEAGDDRRGSWDPTDPWKHEGGRIYSTAINTLTLETYYRYARFRAAK